MKPFVMVSEPSAVASFLKGVPSVGRMVMATPFVLTAFIRFGMRLHDEYSRYFL